MRALLMKDCFVLWKQLRLYVVLMLIFTVFNGAFGNVFIVIWAAMLPYTAMAYDERSKWDQLAAMMPYSNRDLVLSRYILGWIAGAGACLLSLLLQEGFALILHQAVYPDTLIASFFVCLSTLAITLPLIFRFGVERGRLIMFLIIFLVCGSAGALSGIADSLSGTLPAPVWLIVPLSLVLTALSIPLSLRWYTLRRR